ncbi:Hypothetical predicted protein, partial [Pelobates cultripes]
CIASTAVPDHRPYTEVPHDSCPPTQWVPRPSKHLLAQDSAENRSRVLVYTTQAPLKIWIKGSEEVWHNELPAVSLQETKLLIQDSKVTTNVETLRHTCGEGST